jgi:hypothetical protein
MISKTTAVVLSIGFLLFAITTSLVIWADISLAAKLAFFAFGFGAGISTGTWLGQRRS